mgnify:FL=1
MTCELVIAGFGGQGVLSMGKILAYSGLMEDKNVSWMPSYGPEQRGGTANVTVIISDEAVSSPLVNEYDVVIALNQPSVDKFTPRVKPGGILIYDTNGVTHIPEREDIKIYEVPATDEANNMGNAKVFNMLILGATLSVHPMLPLDSIRKGLEKSLPERHHKLIPMNMKALERGGEIIRRHTGQ